MENFYSFIQVTDSMILPDTIYNGRYNKEPAIITIKDGKTSWVQFTNRSAIFDPKGIMISNVEVLLPAQNLTQ
jgi:hypothetical protein